MRFSPAFLDELRARVPVSAVVGRKVRLKREGREWRGLSPFTSEKTPSFFVNDKKGRWFDFSAGKNGDLVSFVMETEGLSFVEAVEKLAGEAGLALPAITREDIARDAQRKTALDALEAAAQFFEAQLLTKGGNQARAYLEGRGLGVQVQETFRIGLAPRDRFALRDHLASKGFSRETMIDAGLLIHGDEIEVPYDRFRDRVMFPICDQRGRVIAFGGRALDPTAPAKYLNSPETDLFHKGSVLFNHHRAKDAAEKTGRVIVVEGYIDVIAMTEAGFPEVVAPLGTALTENQCALLWRMSVEPILCFDGDKAGQKAADRAIDTALPHIAPTRSLRFALLPEGRDPDDLLRTDGAEAIVAVISRAMPLIELLWLRERDRRPLETPEQRADLLHRVSQRVEALGDGFLRNEYLRDLRGRAFRRFSELYRARKSSGEKRAYGFRSTAPAISESLLRSALFTSEVERYPRLSVIFAALIDFPTMIEQFAEEISLLGLPSVDFERLRDCLFKILEQGELNRRVAEDAIDATGCRPSAEKIFRNAGLLRLKADLDGSMPLETLYGFQQALRLQRRLKELEEQRVAVEKFASGLGGISELNEKDWAKIKDMHRHTALREGLDASLEEAHKKSTFH